MPETMNLTGPPDEALSISGMKIAYGSDVILEDFDLTVREGEFLCILGASGCGKSTTLRIVGDLLPATSGDVTVLGDSPAVSWTQLAYVFQSPRLLPWLTAVQNVELAMRYRRIGGSRAERLRIARSKLELVGLAHVADRPAHQLSGGERQRTSIARALAVEPRILLMDEPLSALDVKTRLQLRSDLIDLWSRTGMTVLFVTHDVEEAVALGTRVIVLSSRPAAVIHDVDITISQPRDLSAPFARDLRRRLTKGLDVDEIAGAVS